MKVQILRATIANKRPVFPGKVYDLPEKEAQILIAMGKAREIPNKKETREDTKKDTKTDE